MCDVQKLNKLEDRYEIIEHIGGGTYGEVTKCIDRQNSWKIVALKRILYITPQDGFPQTTIREIMLLKELNHPNIVSLENVIQVISTNSVYLVFEYCSYDLFALLKSDKSFCLNRQYLVISIIKQVLVALHFCSIHHIVHRDLKPANIFLTVNNIVKLGDFGLARKISSSSQHLSYRVITLWYKPPELLLHTHHYGTEVDMWSCGCILYEILTGEVLFMSKHEDDLAQLNIIFDMCGVPTTEDWPEFHENYGKMFNSLDPKPSHLEEFLRTKIPEEWMGILPLILKMLTLNPGKRISAENALNDPFLLKFSNKKTDPNCLPMLDIPEIHQKNVIDQMREARKNKEEKAKNLKGKEQIDAQ